MVKIYCDGAGFGRLEEYAEDPRIEGFTTNPSLMRKAGINDYRAFARTVLLMVKGKPVSFEVVADEWAEMERQACEIQSWGPNVWVKIPITNTRGESSKALIEKLADLNLNITAVMTLGQVDEVWPILRSNHILSVFNGRITDTGVPPMAFKMRGAAQRLWASARSVYDYYQAEAHGFDIITLTPDLIAKLALGGKSLAEYSLETVRMFHEDGKGLTV